MDVDLNVFGSGNANMVVTIHEILKRNVATGLEVTVKGWSRNARHSMVGYPFLVLHDVTPFATTQAVV